jgi:hypothetical protein
MLACSALRGSRRKKAETPMRTNDVVSIPKGYLQSTLACALAAEAVGLIAGSAGCGITGYLALLAS